MHFLVAALFSQLLAFHAHALPSTTPSSSLSSYTRSTAAATWYSTRFRNFVTFGDSYTDENRLSYFGLHGGQAPPPGTLLPESFSTASGGRTWARYVVQYAGSTKEGVWAPALTLYNYAVSGAVCSNSLTPRYLSSIGADFPDLAGYELPAFAADLHTERNGTRTPYYQPARTPANTVYSVWDGTNDVGVNALLTDSQVPGASLPAYVDCIYAQYDALYRAGGRFFVLMNLAPLYLAPLYANASEGGVGASGYWPDKPANLTAVYDQMRESVDTVNAIYAYRTPYEALVANRYPGARWALFDVNQLLVDMHNNPAGYYNGSAPANVTGYVNQCSLTTGECVRDPNPDSFMWFDELHPTEQTDRQIAKEYGNVLAGNSSYATYY